MANEPSIILIVASKDATEKIIHYKEILSKPDRKKFIAVYIMIIDWND